MALGVGVKLKTTNFQILTRQRRLSEATDVMETLYSVGVELLNEFGHAGPFRLVGMVAYDLGRHQGSRSARTFRHFCPATSLGGGNR